jgi:hypothetical protein
MTTNKCSLRGLSEDNTYYRNVCRLQPFSKHNDATKFLTDISCCLSSGWKGLLHEMRLLQYIRTYQQKRLLAKLGTAGSGCRGYMSIFPSWIYFPGYTRLLPLRIKTNQDSLHGSLACCRWYHQEKTRREV